MLVPVVALLASSTLVTSGYLQQAAASVSLVQPSTAYLAYEPGSSSPASSSIGYGSYLRVQASNASAALPLLEFPALVADGGRATNSSVLATDPQAFAALRGSVVYGRPAEEGVQADAGAILARVLGVRVGDNVTVAALSRTQTLTIVGILNSTDQSDTSLIVPLSSSWALWPQTAGKLSYIEFDAPDQAVISKISGNLTVMREEGIAQIATSFDAQTASLLANWTYVLLALSAGAAVAAASRVVTEVSLEFRTIRALGASLSKARALVFYELLLISTVAVVLGVSAGLVATSVLGALLQAFDGLPLFPSVDPGRLAVVSTASLALILGAGSISLAWLPTKINETGESP